jgi:hypothetical protein
VLVAEGGRQPSDQVEQALAARLDVGTVLDVVAGPEAGGGGVITLVEQSVECLEDNRLVLPKSISTPVTANFIMVALEGALGGARLSEQKDLLQHTKQELRLYIELKRQKLPIKKSSTVGSPRK